MRRLALIWLFGIALLGIEIATMVWMRGYTGNVQAADYAAGTTTESPRGAR